MRYLLYFILLFVGCENSTKEEEKETKKKQIVDTLIVNNTKKKAVQLKEKTFIEELDSLFLKEYDTIKKIEYTDFKYSIEQKFPLYTDKLSKKIIHVYESSKKKFGINIYVYKSREAALASFEDIYTCFLEECYELTPKGFIMYNRIVILLDNKIYTPSWLKCKKIKKALSLEDKIFENLLKNKNYRGFTYHCNGGNKKYGDWNNGSE